LVESGVVIIKDSSANKAGVICSSFEIIACLTISKQEFAEIKPVYVQEVIEILKSKAGNEGRLLFSEWKKRSHETDLVKLSYEISQEINQVKDIMSAKLAKLTDKELESEKFNYILLQHCPKILVEKYRDRILTRIPKAHKAAIISAYVASYLVYKEGLNWLESYAPDDVFKIAFEYMEAERAVDRMVLDISASNLPNKEKVLAILKSSGAKYLASH
jgi:glutamate dehydrogenase